MLAHNLHELRARRAAGETGFTLVELLVVVVIIVALAAIAVPIFLNQKGKADDARLQSDATSAGKIMASVVSAGAYDDNGVLDAAKVTLTGGTLTFEGQTVTSDGTFAIYNGTGTTATAGEINPSTGAFCIQVTDADGAVARYASTGGAESKACNVA